ncbi:hypothetical protein CJ030_MR3G011137 [Morella rubra]|uniref:Uncharacterized protein n=1 Tax=Morella rubra TaxID=262757 RepID=A0A6A1W3W6_9ROSI|nr:hypothetical protein CJ030_MR3G011137 [Morella rubra]
MPHSELEPRKSAICSSGSARSLSAALKPYKPEPCSSLQKRPHVLLITIPITRSISKGYYLRSSKHHPPNPLIKPPRFKQRKMGKDSDWTDEEELALIRIVLQKQNTGDSGPTKLGRIKLRNKFATNTRGASSSGKLRVTSSTRRLVLAESSQKTRSLELMLNGSPSMQHSNCGMFRRRGFLNYKIMSLLSTGFVATGKYAHACTTSPPNTDEERELEERLNKMEISSSCGQSTQQTPSERGTAKQSSPNIPVSRKRGSDGSSSINQSKCSKGKFATPAVEDNAMDRFVDIAAKRNNILETWLAS